MINRRKFIALGAAAVTLPFPRLATALAARPIVSIVKVKDDKIDFAVEKAIDLLGGMARLTKGKKRVMLKPNLVAEGPAFTTKMPVIETLARLMMKAGKEVSIGEGSAAAGGHNAKGVEVFQMRDAKLVDAMQKYVFDALGYTELARKLKVPLVNLHTGDMVTIKTPAGLAYKELSFHKSLAATDMLCSVPMMKTHTLGMVTLGMKNLLGLYPGTVYGTVRWKVHDDCFKAGSPGVAYEVLDMVRANKVGLTVVDGSSAMEGNGPCNGTVVPMGVIVAGTDPLATDMVAAQCMEIAPSEVPTFACAHKLGMVPGRIEDIEVRGVAIADVKRAFVRPKIDVWGDIRDYWGNKEM